MSSQQDWNSNPPASISLMLKFWVYNTTHMRCHLIQAYIDFWSIPVDGKDTRLGWAQKKPIICISQNISSLLHRMFWNQRPIISDLHSDTCPGLHRQPHQSLERADSAGIFCEVTACSYDHSLPAANPSHKKDCEHNGFINF